MNHAQPSKSNCPNSTKFPNSQFHLSQRQYLIHSSTFLILNCSTLFISNFSSHLLNQKWKTQMNLRAPLSIIQKPIFLFYFTAFMPLRRIVTKNKLSSHFPLLIFTIRFVKITRAISDLLTYTRSPLHLILWHSFLSIMSKMWRNKKEKKCFFKVINLLRFFVQKKWRKNIKSRFCGGVEFHFCYYFWMWFKNCESEKYVKQFWWWSVWFRRYE